MTIKINGVAMALPTIPVVYDDLTPTEWSKYEEIKQIFNLALVTLALFMAWQMGGFMFLGIKAVTAFIAQL